MFVSGRKKNVGASEKEKKGRTKTKEKFDRGVWELETEHKVKVA
jgi:hypothetical protein